MPSRAVQKKLARREAKRAKAGAAPPVTAAPEKREREISAGAVPQLVPVEDVVVRKKARVELVAAPSPSSAAPSEPKTRKERKKLESQRKLERQMQRVAAESARAVASALTVSELQSQQSTSDDTGASATSGAVAAPNQRHDPKFANGTFWRDRKDKKRRTLFVGNLPATSTSANIITLIDAVVFDSQPSEGEATSSSLVESVDILPKKFGSRVVHAYVTFRTVEASEKAQRHLDGMEMGDNFLRVNNAADKQQRTVAIAKRNGSVQQRGRGFGGGRGFSGRGRGGFSATRGFASGRGGRGFGRGGSP